MRNSTGSPIFSDFQSEHSRVARFLTVGQRERRPWVRGWREWCQVSIFFSQNVLTQYRLNYWPFSTCRASSIGLHMHYSLFILFITPLFLSSLYFLYFKKTNRALMHAVKGYLLGY